MYSIYAKHGYFGNPNTLAIDDSAAVSQLVEKFLDKNASHRLSLRRAAYGWVFKF